MAKGSINVDVFGVKELKKLFDDLDDDALSLQILQDINREGANLYKKEMQNRAPVGSDNIYKSIKIEKDRSDKTSLIIGPSLKAFWARFIERGTKVRTTKGRGPVQFKRGERGKINPEPFIQPAIESATPNAKKRIFDNMGKRVLNFLKRRTKQINNKISKLK